MKVISGWSYSPSEYINPDLLEYCIINMFQYSSIDKLRYVQYQEPNYVVTYSSGVITDIQHTERTIATKTINVSFSSNEVTRRGIKDWNGNIIWECPYGKEVNGFTVTLLKGISHVLLQFIPSNTDLDDQVAINSGFGFTYDCRHPGLFVDSYQDYILKNRDYDISMRQIQSEKQELQAWVSAAENVGFGAAFGQKAGAAAAGIGGVIEAFGTHLINNIFDPKIQAQYDMRYARMTDQISLIGDSVTNTYIEHPLSKYELRMDDATINRMKNDIQTNGFYCDEITDNLQNMFSYTTLTRYIGDVRLEVKPVYQADNVVVEGACNVIGKQQVVRRLMNGVEFI